MELAIEAIALRLDPDGPKPDDPRLNRLRITNEFGNTRISALFDPVNAEVVLNAIRRAVDAERWASGMKGGHDTAAGRPIGKESLAEGPPPKKPDLTSSAAAATDTILRSGAVGPPVPPGCGAVGRSGTERGHGNDRLNGFDAESIPSESDENLDVDQVAPEQNQPNHPLTAEDVHRFGALPEEPGDSIARLQGQAFLRICERALTAWDRPGRPPTAHIDLIMHEDDAGFAATRTTDGLVDGDRLAELMCNAVYRLVKVDRAGTPLEIGRAQRLATADQRRAVFLRDGGCVFPGCAAPVTATDLHHVERWRDGGATDLDNLACLCRFHHSVTHSTGWHMSGHAPTSELPHRFEWRTPAGDMLRSVHHPATTQRQKTG